MLEVRVADRVEPLLDELVRILRVPPEDPFDEDWVAVPSIGMRRWLAQRLSERLGTSGDGTDGVTANVALPFPAELRRRVLAAAGTDETDPWDVERLPWAVLEVLSGAEDQVLAPLATVSRGATLAGRALALADLVDRYSLHRPEMVRAWLDGRDVDAAGQPLDADRRWQAELVRRLRRSIGVPGPAERLPDLVAALAAGALSVRLPERLVLFGLSTVPPDLIQLAEALASTRRVHALLAAPSVDLAVRVADGARAASSLGSRAAHPTADLVRNPLLRSWGSPSRETAALLGLAGIPVEPVGRPTGAQTPSDPDRPTLFDLLDDERDDEGAGAPTSLLDRLRSDLRADRPPDGSHVLDPGDRSVQVHACTGITRQVEVLRDAVLHLLAADPDLTEGDVAVLCPRIEVFSPVIQAVLGPSAEVDAAPGRAGSGAPRLRYRVTDRTVRSDVPLLGVVGALIDLVPGRFTASAVADFLGLGPVRDRFGLGVEDLGRLDDWIERTRIRWGLDGPHRAAWGLPPDFEANSWSAGIDQLLLGTVVRADEDTLAVGGVAPLPVADGSMVLAARVADAVRSLARARDELVDPRPVAAWAVALRDAVDHLCSLPPTEAWQRRRFDRVLDELVAAAAGPDGTPGGVPLTLGDLRRFLSDRLVGDPARAAFGTGAVTFCSLSPLRSVPHKVVCILGLDQDAMPRGLTSGDDLLALAPALGDRDPRAEARQLLLEAVLAARDTLVITAGAADVRTNAPVPPAVVLDEFWDHLGDLCTDPPEEVRRRLGTVHPRQAFDAANFVPDGPSGPGRPWSFDPGARDGAVALSSRAPDAVAGPLLDEPLGAPSRPEPVVALADLHRFLRRPVETFFVDRLGLRLPRVDDEGVDDLPVKLDPLESYQVGDQLLACLVSGVAPDRIVGVLRARGVLPPGRLGDEEAERVGAEVEEYRTTAAGLGVGLRADDPREVDLVVGDRRLRGVVPCGTGVEPGPLMVRFSRPKDHHRLLLAVDLLALTLAHPEVVWRAVSIHRGAKSGAPPTTNVLRVRGDGPDERTERAEVALDHLLALRDRGLRLPLPLFDETSRALFEAGPRPGAVQLGPARKAWSDDTWGPECEDPYHRLAFGSPSVVELLAMTVGGTDALGLAHELWGTVEDAVATVDEDDR